MKREGPAVTRKGKILAGMSAILGVALVLGLWLLRRGCTQREDGPRASGESAHRGETVRAENEVLVIVRGRLRDEAGKPVPGASVLVTRYGLGLALPEAFQVTDASGAFDVVSSGVGVLDLEVIAPHCARIRRHFEVRPSLMQRGRKGKKGGEAEKGTTTFGEAKRQGNVAMLDVGTLVCLPGGGLVGRVVDDKGKALAGALILARRIEPLGLSGQAFYGLADKDGGFAIEHLGVGRYEVTVSAEGYNRQVFESVEVPGRMGIVSLSVLVELSGKVTRDGRPVAGAHVRLSGSGLWPGLSTDTDQDGRFHFRNLGRGIYDIEAWKGSRRSKPLVGLMLGLGGGPCTLEFAGRDPASKDCPKVVLALEPGITISGKVVEAGTNRPLSDARLVLGRGLLTSLALRVESDDQGSFRLEAVLPGRYYLAVDREGYLSWSAVRVRVRRSQGLSSPDRSDIQTGFSRSADGGGISTLRIVMDRGAGIAGRVVDDVGNPVAGAKLSVVYAGKGLWAGTWSGRTERVRRGLFERALAVSSTGLGGNESLGVVPGPVPVVPAHPGAGQGSSSLSDWFRRAAGRDGGRTGGNGPDAGPEHVPGRAGSEGVSRRDGGMARAWADAGPVDAGHADAAVVPATRPERFVTDQQGRFRIQGLPPGRILILVTHPSYAESRSRKLRLRIGRVLDDLRIVMRPGLDVEGRVDDEDGAPQRGVFVTATDRLGLVLGRLGRTDRDGHFLLRNLAGRVHLRFEKPGYLSLVLDLDLGGARRSRRIRVVLKRADRVFEGWVTDPDGHPIGGVLVEAVSLDPSSPGRSAAVTDAKGDFRVVGLGPVAYLVRLSHPDYPRAEFSHLDISRRTHLTLHYGGGFEGLARDRGTRALVRNLSARLVGPSGPGQTRTFPEGEVVWKGLAAGRYRLTLSADGYAPVTVALQIPEGSGPSQITLRNQEWWLDLAGSIEGLVRDDRGFPVFRAEVWCERSGKRLGPVGHGARGVVLTDRKGHFVLMDLPSGRCLLRASHPDLGSGRMRVEILAGSSPSQVTLDLNGTPEQSREKVVSGVAVQLAANGDDVVISRVVSGSKAEAAGLRVGDRIQSIDGQSVEGEGLADLARRLEGPVGSTVVIEVEREGRRVSLPVEREMLSAGR